MFVESRDIVVRGFGVGKLVETNGLRGVIRYFVSPTDPQVDRVVARDSIHDVELTSHERVFFRQGGTWRVGRLEGYVAPDELGLRLPNMDRARVRVEDAYVRSNLPLPNPLGLLKARNTETPFWHEGRAAFLRSVAEQRAVYRGLAALASSNVEVLRHQIAVAHRVLRDPVPRYLLADEVGLGKTIEAGLIVRQHLSDKQNRALVVVAVPENLVGQWESELRDRFHIDYSFQVYVVGHRELPRCAQEYQNISFLVIDEAHEVARHAYDESESGAWYRAAGQIANRCEGVLLLSATPVLHHEDAFLAMLHLLDPATHPLEHRERFRRRVENREVVANSVRDLEDGATGFFIEPVLEQLAPLSVGNPHLVELIDTVAGLLDQSVDDPNRQRAIAKLRTHLQECYRLDRRLLRTRRAQERVRDNLPRRARNSKTPADWRRLNGLTSGDSTQQTPKIANCAAPRSWTCWAQA
jgi:ATP-dependent helicase HepA